MASDVRQSKPGGPNVVLTNAGTNSRTERRQKWWHMKRKADEDGNEADSSSANNNGDIVETSPKKKLRNRDTIAKPEILKYEPNLNRGFQSKLLQNLIVDSGKKKVKKGSKQEPSTLNKNNSSPPTKPKSQPKQDNRIPVSASAEPNAETFDSYKFSLSLINGQADTAATVPKKDSKKYVLFIGNLPFDVTKEQLEEHFRKTGGIKSIRIPKHKGSEKTKGFAFMEFDGRISHGIALRLHQTTFGGRKINVEFTSIGGGNSDARKQKLKHKNEKRRKAEVKTQKQSGAK